ncbi:MAG: nitroreductase family protein [Pseudomonadota bacterium]|nr:nitroreductase family protein [Pseudomonadota bacterium]
MNQSRGNNADDLALPGTGAAPVRALVGVKERLQFTGWLQYLLPVVIGLGLMALGGLGALIRPSLWWLMPGGVLVARGLADIVILKLRLIPLPRRGLRPVTGDGFAVMRARRACRSFEPRRMDEADEAFVRDRVEVHTGTGNPAALTGMPIRAEFVDAPLTVWPVVGAQQFLAVLGPAEYDRLAVIEAGRALQEVVLDLTARGIATCWIGPGAERQSVVTALGPRFDAHRDHVLCVIAIGYASHWMPLMARMMRLAMHRRKPFADLVFAGAPGVPARLDRGPLKPFAKVFAACRAAPSSYNSQTTRAVVEVDGKSLKQVSFCTTEGSRYYAPLALGIWCANWARGVEALGAPGHWRPLPAPRALGGGLVEDVVWTP